MRLEEEVTLMKVIHWSGARARGSEGKLSLNGFFGPIKQAVKQHKGIYFSSAELSIYAPLLSLLEL